MIPDITCNVICFWLAHYGFEPFNYNTHALRAYYLRGTCTALNTRNDFIRRYIERVTSRKRLRESL